MATEPSDRPKVLLADDSKIVRASARKQIGGDTDLILAESGEEAWAAITSDPDILVVFTDVSMPGLDGYGLLRRIREDERELVNQLPVIMVTGHDEEGAREQALERGATDFINKPFDRAELMARAQAHATRDQVRRRASALESSQTQDAATGLGNARYFEKRLQTSRAYTQRHGLPMALIHVDCLDAGNRLREAGQRLAHHLREGDVLVHIGQGRFAAICPNCEADGARPLAERLLGALRTDDAGSAPDLAAAAGVYLPATDDKLDLRTIYSRARATIDRARQEGDGALIVEGVEEPAEPAPGEQVPSLDEALEMLATEGGAQRLEAHMPELLERCARLFEAAPPEVAAPILQRLQAATGADGQQEATPGARVCAEHGRTQMDSA